MTAPVEVTPERTRPEFAPSLQTIVELVRRIVHADVACILGFSLSDETVTWKAASGFTVNVDYQQTFFRPLGSGLARRALETNTIALVQGIGERVEFPAEDFPVHASEGISDLAIAPLRILGSSSGALIAGYRSPHQFSEEEQGLLRDLAEMGAVVLQSARLVESVSAAEEIWEQTFDAIGEGILVHDHEKRIVRCNLGAAEMMNTTPAAVLGLSFSDVFATLFGKQAAAYYIDHGSRTLSSFEVQSPEGRRYFVSIFPIRTPHGDAGGVITLNDVTRESEIREQLARSRRLGSVGQLAAGVAHEINNPLAAIATCAEAIIRDLRRTGEAPAASAEEQWINYLEEIVRQSLRCKEITRGLLDLTQQREAKRILCDINLIASQCAKNAAQQAGAAAIEFEMTLDEGLGQLATDAGMVRQVIDNLLSNAAAALGEGGGKIGISTLRDGDRVMVEVVDTGEGIPAGVLPRIFDPFFSTKGPGKGYGLGLAISAALAESLGGALTVESKDGVGSKFRLWIPRRAPEK